MKRTIIFSVMGLLFISCSTSQKGQQSQQSQQSQEVQHTKGAINLDRLSKEKVVKLKVGEIKVVEGTTNPSTGYAWNVSSSKTCDVKLVKQYDINNNTSLKVGAPSKAVFEFKGIKKGECLMLFDYTRSYKSETDENTKRIKFIVE